MEEKSLIPFIMKTIFTLLLFLVPSGFIFAQCPSAGQDSIPTYCPNELFDVADLRSDDADTNGVFIDPYSDTMTNTVISLTIPGQYTFFYLVSDTSCPVDSAKYVIIIYQGCTGGLSENTLENNWLIRSNPVKDELILIDPDYDLLEVYETSGRLVLRFSTEKSSLDVSSLQNGNYLLIHEKNGVRQFQRFQKF